VNRGILFTIDGLIALMFIILSIVIFTTNTTDNTEQYLITEKISDLLITSQKLEITSLNTLEENYNKLIPKEGYIKINNKFKKINTNNSKDKKVISQAITYINSSNNEIYIEIGVYY